MKLFPQKVNAAAATYQFEGVTNQPTDAVFIRQNKYVMPALITVIVALLIAVILLYVQSSVGKATNANDLNSMQIEAMQADIAELALTMETQRQELTNELNRLQDTQNADKREILALLTTYQANFKAIEKTLNTIAASNISSIQQGKKKVKK